MPATAGDDHEEQREGPTTGSNAPDKKRQAIPERRLRPSMAARTIPAVPALSAPSCEAHVGEQAGSHDK